MIRLIGDTHFGHRKILEYESEARPFSTIQEHDDELVRRWNSVVEHHDVVFHVGDVAFGGRKVVERVFQRLNGRKRLILGNHDDIGKGYLTQWFEKITLWYPLPSYGVVLSHMPLHPSILGDNINIHGHTHSRDVGPGYINVSAEKINLTPISIEELLYEKQDD